MLPRRLAQICQAQNVQRLIHVSALGVQPTPELAPSNYLRSKSAGEVALRTSKWLNLTVLRPSVIFGEHDRFMNLFACLQRQMPLMPLADSEARLQPVWVEDVARAIVHSLDAPETIGQTLECAGPQVMSLGDIVRCAGVWSGHPRPVLPLPHWAGYIQAGLLECLPGEPLMSRDNVASLTVANVATGQCPGLIQWGIIPTAMNSVMPGVLGRRVGPARFDAWRRRGSQ
jgi:NADH dehydrogenase